MRTTPCEGCGKPMVWAYIVKDGVRTGKRVPLDPRPVVYRLVGGFDALDYEAQAITQADGMVTHFATCRDANKF
jgi:hypothetical protein